MSLVFSDVTDPDHIEDWHEFASTNPELAREILKRAFIDHRDSPETQRRLINTISFAMAALKRAFRRATTNDDAPTSTV